MVKDKSILDSSTFPALLQINPSPYSNVHQNDSNTPERPTQVLLSAFQVLTTLLVAGAIH